MWATPVEIGQPLANLDGRSLPRAIRSQQPETLSLLHLKVEVIHRYYILKGLSHSA
jgi:hypothetical protein